MSISQFIVIPHLIRKFSAFKLILNFIKLGSAFCYLKCSFTNNSCMPLYHVIKQSNDLSNVKQEITQPSFPTLFIWENITYTTDAFTMSKRINYLVY